MVDRYTEEKRSEIMSRVRNKDTVIEKTVRSWLHGCGYRFRLHVRNLPGCPDVVLSKYKTVIFVHGCFWHQHQGCKKAVLPKTNVEFWRNKLGRNVIRDEEIKKQLERIGWRVIVIWQCEVNSLDKMKRLFP
jgi:DNA mismatch endonuclease (patch repair protein)